MTKVLALLALLATPVAGQTLAEYLDPDRTIAYAGSADREIRRELWEPLRTFLLYDLGLPIDEVEDLAFRGVAFAVLDLPRSGEAGFAFEGGGTDELRQAVESAFARGLAGWEAATEQGIEVRRRGERLRIVLARADDDVGRVLVTNRLELARRWRDREVRTPSLDDRLGSSPLEVHLDAPAFLRRVAERQGVGRLLDLVPGRRDRIVRTNEAAAIETLRALAAAQERFLATDLVDTDADGEGEHGYIQELAGTAPCRSSGRTALPALVPRAWGAAVESTRGFLEKGGYVFRLHLPASEGPAVAERAPLPDEKDTYADLQETRWVCYAWPIEAGRTGRRVFAVGPGGVVLAAANEDARYEGRDPAPEAGAAFADPGGDLTAAFGPPDAPASDGQRWRIVRP